MKNEKKFELTEEHKIIKMGITIYRIIALKDFDNIKKGDLGGFLEKELNLSQEGNCWVDYNAKVFGNAKVSGNAWVYSNAKVFGNAWVHGDALVSSNAWVSDKASIYGNARISGKARISGNAHISGNAKINGNASIYSNNDYTLVQGFGTENRTTTFYKCKDNNIRVSCGCFNGTLDDFRKQVKDTRKEKIQSEYLEIADFMERHFSKENTLHDCQTLDYCDRVDFEKSVTDLLNKGYTMQSSSCNSSKSWKAIMIK